MEEVLIKAKKILEKSDLFGKKTLIRQIEADSTRPDFWKDSKTASDKMKEMARLGQEVNDLETLSNLIENSNISVLEPLVEKLEDNLFFSGPYDKGSAILSLHAGQGGVEAMDWTNMLYRMYTRYFEKKGWKYNILDETRGEEAGLKTIIVSVDGFSSYGYLKHEAGVHRLVRQSPFNADNLRQTSFALVEVLPNIEEDAAISVRDDELDWDFFRSGGHGGQNVNKVATAVRLKHIPTGITVTASGERYQGKNREFALKMLKAKLWLLQEEERKKAEAVLKGGYKTPGWGNQIRSYVLHPYKMVKDLRTGYEVSNADVVLDGDLDGFIEEELRKL